MAPPWLDSPGSVLHLECAGVGGRTGKSWQAGLIMEEAGPQLCPEASAGNCLGQHSLGLVLLHPRAYHIQLSPGIESSQRE